MPTSDPRGLAFLEPFYIVYNKFVKNNARALDTHLEICSQAV